MRLEVVPGEVVGDGCCYADVQEEAGRQLLCRGGQVGVYLLFEDCAGDFVHDAWLVWDYSRYFGRGRAIYDPWHCVPVLVRKPAALRNGAPFRDWVLPSGLKRVRRKLHGVDDGDRQMVDIFAAVLTEGLPALDAACAEALAQGVHSADVILNILERSRDPAPPPLLLTSPTLRLVHEPVAYC